MPRRRGGRPGGLSLDPKLLPRINSYLAGKDKKSRKRGYVDADEVIEYLCAAFPEYKRKPQAQFKSSIERILERVVGQQASSGEDSLNSDSSYEMDPDVQLVEIKDTNMMNSSLRRVYKEQNAAADSDPNPATPATDNQENGGPVDADDDDMGVEYLSASSQGTTGGTDGTLAGDGDSAGGAPSEANTRPKKRARKLNQSDGAVGDEEATSTTRVIKKKKKVPSSSTTTTTTSSTSGRLKRVKKKQVGGALAKHFGVEDAPPNEDLREGRLGLAPIPKTRYADLGGVEEILQDVRELIEWPLQHPELYKHLGVEPSTGILLHGPPGCGKTLLASAIAGEMGVPFFKLSAPEIVSGMSGESESKLRKLFADAMAMAPAIVFIDEIDAITPRRETTEREMSRRIVAQFLTCMDELSHPPDDMEGVVIVIGATNRPDALDPAIRQAGRFSREIAMTIPDEAARESILRVLSAKLRLSGDFDYRHIAHLTPGYVGADLEALTKEAANLAVHRIFNQLQVAVALPIGPSSSTNQEKGMEEGNDPMVTEKLDQMSIEEVQGEGKGKEKEKEEEEKTEKEKEKEKEKEPEKEKGMEEDVEEEEGGAEVGKVSQDRTNPLFETPHDKKKRILLERQRTSENLRGQQKLTEMQLAPLTITMTDFEEAIKRVQPSAKREGFATIPDVSWDDVGALSDLREELSLCILGPIHKPMVYHRMGLSVATGVLLYGPPGCGKTLLAKAIANEAGFNFISVKGPELLNKFVGESERAVRAVFQRGRASSPCIIFFDELDALCPRRDGDSNNNSSQRVVNQMLTEMDGLESRKSVYLIAATNRPDIIDPAVLRPGRLDKLLYVPLPGPSDRVEILQTLTKKIPMDSTVDLQSIGVRCNRYSGADLTALVREASLIAVKKAMFEHPELTDPMHPSLCLTSAHFEEALRKIRPSVSAKDEKMYKMKQRQFSTTGPPDKAEGATKE